MKKFLLSLLALVAIAACSNGESEEQGGTQNKHELVLDTSSADFTSDGGSCTISFTTNGAWSVQIINSHADEWCSVSSTSGDAGNSSITITAQPNNTTEDRSATVVIKVGAVSKTIWVKQKQKDALTITASEFEVAAEGGEVGIEVKANIDFEYAIDESAQSWIKYSGSRAIKTSTLLFKVAENEDLQRREAKIYIRSGSFNETITIYQAGSVPSIVISQNEYIVSSDGETVAVKVKSNVDVAVELPAGVDWISESASRATSTNTYRFDVSPNEEYDQRAAEIRFINKENNLSEVVAIIQSQKDAIVLAKDSYAVESKGGQIQIEVGYNVDFDIEISNNWISMENNTRALAVDIITFVVAENASLMDREGYIIFKSTDSKITQTVKINQGRGDTNIESPETGGENEW